MNIFLAINENSTLSVSVNTTFNGTEENIHFKETTKTFKSSISVKKYKFGPETNRSIYIYIYDFTTPLTIKVLFLIIFAVREIDINPDASSKL